MVWHWERQELRVSILLRHSSCSFHSVESWISILGSAAVLRFFLWGPLASFNDPRTKKRAKASLDQLTCLHYSITNRERRCHVVNRVRLHEAATRNSPGLNQAWLTIQPRTKSEDHSIDSPRHWRYKFFFVSVRLLQICSKTTTGNETMQESTRLLSAVKKTAALPCKQCLGGQQFPPFYSYQKNAADLCISSDKHGLASVQKQSRQKTGDCPQMHAMTTKRTNPTLTVQCQHGFKGPRQNYKGQTHDATPTHTHTYI